MALPRELVRPTGGTGVILDARGNEVEPSSIPLATRVFRLPSSLGYVAGLGVHLFALGDPLWRSRYHFAPACCLSLAKVLADCSQVVVEPGSVLFPILADFVNNGIVHLSGTSISSGGVQITGAT